MNAPGKGKRRVYGRTIKCRSCDTDQPADQITHRGGFNEYHCTDRVACALIQQKRSGFRSDELYNPRAPGPFDGGAELREKLRQWAALTCSCGNFYTWAEYLNLPPAASGSQMSTEDEAGQPIVLELRNCSCGSTMARSKP